MTTIYAIYTRDPLNKNAELGDCVLENETKDGAISEAAEYFRDQMLEDVPPSELSVGEHEQDCLIVYEDDAGEHIEPVTIKWHIDSDDTYSLDMRSEHFNQRDFV